MTMMMTTTNTVTNNSEQNGKRYSYGSTTIDESDFAYLLSEYHNINNNQNMISSINSQLWTTVHESTDGNLKVYRRLENLNQKKNEIFTFKAYMNFPNISDPTILYSLACDLTVRKLWDPIYITVEEVERLNDEANDVNEIADVIYTQLKMPYPVMNRDSCLLRVIKQQNDLIMVICKTTEHEKCKLLNSKFVRTFTPMHAYVIERVRNDQGKWWCRFFVLSTHDPMGSIPKFIVKMVLSRSPVQWYTQLKSVSEKVMVLLEKDAATVETNPPITSLNSERSRERIRSVLMLRSKL